MSIEYVYGRLRGRRSRLLKPEVYEMLIRESIDSYENILKDTPYGRMLSQLKGVKSGVNLYVSAIDKVFAEEMRKLRDILSNDVEIISLDTYLSRWDLHNFITVVRGKFYGVSDKEIDLALLPAGVLDDVRLKELLREEDAVSVVDRAKIAFKGLPFSISREAVLELRKGNLSGFEYNIYTSFYSNVFSKDVHPLVKEFYSYTVDSKNISMAYLSLSSGKRPSYWIDGGYISPKIKRQVLALDSTDELESLVRKYAKLEGAFSLEKVERSFEGKFFEDVRKGFAVQPVSFYAVMEYLWRFENEVVKLRTITYGKSFGLSPEKLREVAYV